MVFEELILNNKVVVKLSILSNTDVFVYFLNFFIHTQKWREVPGVPLKNAFMTDIS